MNEEQDTAIAHARRCMLHARDRYNAAVRRMHDVQLCGAASHKWEVKKLQEDWIEAKLALLAAEIAHKRAMLALRSSSSPLPRSTTRATRAKTRAHDAYTYDHMKSAYGYKSPGVKRSPRADALYVDTPATEIHMFHFQ